MREAERADIAAHLHDSVLQALTLIRASAEDPARVRAIALTEERELRAWLYTGHAQAADSLDAAVTEAVVGVESRYGVPISVVVVGDMRPGPGELALVAALAEACQNAVRHGAHPSPFTSRCAPEPLKPSSKTTAKDSTPPPSRPTATACATLSSDACAELGETLRSGVSPAEPKLL